MKVSILQYDTAWQNVDANLTYVKQKLDKLEADIELLLLPEMFTTGFTNDVIEFAESMEGNTIFTLKKWASDYQLAICGSLLIQEDGKYYNRLVFVKPNGEINTYDKRHLFTMGDEDKVYTPGTSCKIIEYKGWRIKPQICYDLRFPVWSRNTENYDLLIYVTNWPKPRHQVYDTLLHARAIENQCYVCATNRTGTDGNSIPYIGHSQMIDSKGKTLVEAQETSEIISYTLSKEELDTFRKKFPVLEDGDGFVIPTVPQDL